MYTILFEIGECPMIAHQKTKAGVEKLVHECRCLAEYFEVWVCDELILTVDFRRGHV